MKNVLSDWNGVRNTAGYIMMLALMLCFATYAMHVLLKVKF